MPNGGLHGEYYPALTHEDYHRIENEKRARDALCAPIREEAMRWLRANLPAPMVKTQEGNWEQSADILVTLPESGKLLLAEVNRRCLWEIYVNVGEITGAPGYHRIRIEWPFQHDNRKRG